LARFLAVQARCRSAGDNGIVERFGRPWSSLGSGMSGVTTGSVSSRLPDRGAGGGSGAPINPIFYLVPMSRFAPGA